jgi:long-chain-fatty-acid--[acyl-carrier-protein] ligase
MKNASSIFRMLCAHVTAAACRLLLGLRYRVTLAGLDSLSSHGGCLILGNHPAEIEPLVFAAFTWRRLCARAVVLKDVYRLAYTHWMFWINRAIPVPDLEVERSRSSVHELHHALHEIIAGVCAGHNVLFYPSGRLYRTGRETIGNASGLHLLLKRAPDMPIMLVRTRGFWGSSFSCASGGKPDLGRALVEGVKTLARNLVLFCPRRQISIECVRAPAAMPRMADRVTLNRWLENWFNQPGEEPLTHVPYRCRLSLPVRAISHNHVWNEKYRRVSVCGRQEAK